MLRGASASPMWCKGTTSTTHHWVQLTGLSTEQPCIAAAQWLNLSSAMCLCGQSKLVTWPDWVLATSFVLHPKFVLLSAASRRARPCRCYPLGSAALDSKPLVCLPMLCCSFRSLKLDGPYLWKSHSFPYARTYRYGMYAAVWVALATSCTPSPAAWHRLLLCFHSGKYL